MGGHFALIVQGRIVEKISLREEAGQMEDLSSFSVFLSTMLVPWISRKSSERFLRKRGLRKTSIFIHLELVSVRKKKVALYPDVLTT